MDHHSVSAGGLWHVGVCTPCIILTEQRLAVRRVIEAKPRPRCATQVHFDIFEHMASRGLHYAFATINVDYPSKTLGLWDFAADYAETHFNTEQRARLDANGFWGNHSIAAPAKESFPMVYNEFEVRRHVTSVGASLVCLCHANSHGQLGSRAGHLLQNSLLLRRTGGSCVPHAGQKMQFCAAAAVPEPGQHMQPKSRCEPQVLHVRRFQEPDIVQFANAVDATHKIYEKRCAGLYRRQCAVVAPLVDVARRSWRHCSRV